MTGRHLLAPAAMLLLACLAAPAAAETAHAPPAKPADGAGDTPAVKLPMIEGSAEDWAVSQSGAGCYLMSPYRKGASRLALGRHPTLGLGIFIVHFALAVPRGSQAEPMLLQLGGKTLTRTGLITADRIASIPLDAGEVAASLAELVSKGALWVQIRGNWLMHDGRAVKEAAAAYGKTCAADNSNSG